MANFIFTIYILEKIDVAFDVVETVFKETGATPEHPRTKGSRKNKLTYFCANPCGLGDKE